jgi:hypothetical protein
LTKADAAPLRSQDATGRCLGLLFGIAIAAKFPDQALPAGALRCTIGLSPDLLCSYNPETAKDVHPFNPRDRSRISVNEGTGQ